MSCRTSESIRRDEGGFTLVELLVTMTLALVVLFAVLQGADIFRSTSEASTRRADTQEQLRRTLRTMVSELRQAPTPSGATSPLVSPSGAFMSSTDLVVNTRQGWTRYCAGGTGQTTLYVSRTSTPPSGVCGSGGAVVVVRDLLRDAGRLFTYTARADFLSNGCAAAATAPCLPPATEVRGLGIRLAIAPSAGSTPLVTTSAVSFRNRTP